MSPRLLLVGQALVCLGLLAASAHFAGHPPSSVQRVVGLQSTSADGDFPRQAVDAFGDRFLIDQRPQLLASQALVTDEFLFALSAPERIAAVSIVAADPRLSFVADRVGSAVATEDPEVLALHRPDLLLASHTARADYVELSRGLGIPVFRALTIFQDLDQVASALGVTGYLTGDDEAAAREAALLDSRIEAARSLRPPGVPGPRVLAFSNLANTFGEGSLFDWMVTSLGGVNVASERGIGPYGSISTEHVAAWNPDWIVAGVDADRAASERQRLLADPGVGVTRAARRGQLLLVENRAYLAMSHHAVELMEAMAQAFYGAG